MPLSEYHVSSPEMSPCKESSYGVGYYPFWTHPVRLFGWTVPWILLTVVKISRIRATPRAGVTRMRKCVALTHACVAKVKLFKMLCGTHIQVRCQ